MKTDPVRGKTLRWSFKDGPTKNKMFEHTFEKDGSVSYRMLDQDGNGKPTREKKYEVATVGENVYAISYLGSSGYTLTVVLDYDSGEAVAFASNEKSLTLQHGTFDEVQSSTNKTAGSSKNKKPAPKKSAPKRRNGASSHAARAH